MESKKRVYCLYRVSTLEQVENDDIPLQKESCREFAERQGWEITREFYEKGVSGFKVSSKDRDAILEIQREAAMGNFDILLVFMFDRLGRRDDETPFVVEWFIRNNISVWSVNEGEQRLDSHVDKLLNYIRYWQASGESIKTSIRVKAALAKLVSEGHYAGGGIPPFGYRLEKSGRFNTKKGKEVGDIVVYEPEADVVKTIFSKYVNEGYGPYRIAQHLRELGVVKFNGKPFSTANVYKVLTNEINIGYLHFGENRNHVPRLQIIDDDLFNRAQEIRCMRSMKDSDDRRVPLVTKGVTLLSGNIFCGHCGKRLWADSSSVKYTRKDGSGSSYKYPRYSCIYGTAHAETNCQKTYTAKKIDDIVRSVLQQVFEQIRETPPAVCWEKQHERTMSGIKSKIKVITRNISKLDKELSSYKGEVIKVIQGESAFTAELLNPLIRETEDKLSTQSAELERLQSELNESDSLFEKAKTEQIRIRSWSEIFDESSPETQKMVAASLIGAVRVSRGYQIEIDFNVSAKEFVECISFNGEMLHVSVGN